MPASSSRSPLQRNRAWLKTYAFTRAAVSAVWVVSAFTLGKSLPIAAAMLIAYPIWDALANIADAQRNGGIKASPTQALNAAISLLTAAAVAVALRTGMNDVLGVFGAWAILSGLLQLATGVRRWKAGGQWAMVLSGAQSALAGGYFIKLALGAPVPSIRDIAPYAAFGAFYFAMSALWLTFAPRRQAPDTAQ